MSVKFNGFSQDDINKVSKKTGGEVKVFATSSRMGLRRVGASEPKVPASKTNIKVANAASTTNSVNNKHKNDVNFNDTTLEEVVDLDESMSTSLEEAIYYKPKSKTRKSEEKKEAAKNSLENVDKDVDVSDEIHMVRGVSLKDFQTHQKLMEEQNKQKKDLLYKAIEQHTQKTAAEWKKMEEIKSELLKLDSELATDVAILRKQIEIACINYSNIEKQYNRIESQFLRAKIDLHNASEKKELLTEHLCTVISHNEDRKAKKLTELMEKVGISPAGEYQNNGIDDSVSSSCSIENIQES